MGEYPEWLPPLVRLEDYDGNWWAYKEACSKYYCADFVDRDDDLYFKSKIVMRDDDITEYGWEETFRSIVQGHKKDKNEQDMSRFEKIRWVRPMIEAANEDKIPWWRNIRPSGGKRGPQERLVIALPDFSYKVVMREAKDKYVLFDAYTCYGREISQMRKEYDEWVKGV